ncbi:PEP-CTERM domain protein [Desulfovibrio inopinatus]|uniref:PEP-CTERM domain protein n=1 Tax=Desulfovibrio inopinatus TaxID=102109 RepID=UPI00041DA72E|nr:PEP-CTERM domain protein [Desulfovibrio inopinatus]
MKTRHLLYSASVFIILCTVMIGGQAQAAYNSIDLSTFESYGKKNQSTGDASYTGQELILDSDAWKAVNISNLDLDNIAKLKLTFDFKASAESDIQGIGFATGSSSSSVYESDLRKNAYKLSGLAKYNCSNSSYTYTENGEWQSFSINLSSLYDTDSDFDYLVFFNDYDGNVKGSSPSEVAFRNVAIASTPIPGALWLFGSGLLGVVMIRRKRV